MAGGRKETDCYKRGLRFSFSDEVDSDLSQRWEGGLSIVVIGDEKLEAAS